MKNKALTFAAQGIAAAILFMASGMKFFGSADTVAIFQALGMEPAGRFLIAFIEMGAALLLISPFAASGAALAVSVMCGAIIAHCTQIGMVVDDDGGMHMLLLVAVFLASLYVLIARRKELPIIGGTL